jgi:hypothetical protein
MGGMQQGFSMMNLPSQLGGQMNVPSNLFGGGSMSSNGVFTPTSGFPGYNANGANAPMAMSSGSGAVSDAGSDAPQMPQGTPPWMLSSQGSQQPPWMSQGGGQTPPWMSQMMMPGSQQGNGLNPNTMSPSSILGQIAAGQGPGAAVSTLPAWQAGVAAQQYNIQQGADNLAEQFNNAGGLFSNAYGSAAGQYQTQATLGENAQLSQSMLQAQEAAQGIQAGAAGQYSSQGLQANEALMQNQLASLGLGSQLGGQQYSTQQNTDTANYMNWLNSQPYSNPYLSMAYGASTTYPPQTYQPGWMTSLLSAGGQAAQGAGTLYGSGIFS